MVRRRCIAVLSVAAFLTIFFPILGTCGGSCAPTDRDGPSQRADQQMPPGPAPSAPSGSNFFAAGSVGNVGVTGTNGASPSLTMSSLGLNDRFGWSVRLKYKLEKDTLLLPVTFVADYAESYAKGSVGNFTGNPGGDPSAPVNGLPVTSRFGLSMLSFFADIDAASAVDLPVQAGLRLSHITYISDFGWDQPASGMSADRARSFGMPGFGLWANINFARLTGYGQVQTTGGTVAPVLHLAAGYGKGGEMDYSMWEASLEVFQSASVAATDFATLPSFLFEVGWARYFFNETLDRMAAGSSSLSNAEQQVDVMILRVTGELPRI